VSKKTAKRRDLDEWDAEIEEDFRRAVAAAKAVGRRKKKVEAFVKVPLWWIEIAAKDARSPTTLVLIELLYASWKAKSSTFQLPNSRLNKLGVSREVKRKVLRNLERRPIILVERRPRKAPIITLIGL
jgi:hypothetical protein